MTSLLESLMSRKADSPAVQVASHPQVTQVRTSVERQRSICCHC